ncbi:MAG: cell division protein CrgA [Acidimicrobiia bacterium]
MSKPINKKASGGRVTPKGTRPGDARRRAVAEDTTASHAPAASTRYTPPTPANQKPTFTAPWVVPVMFALLGVGIIVIVLNYMGLLPGATSNWYLIVGLAAILGGIVTATQLH